MKSVETMEKINFIKEYLIKGFNFETIQLKANKKGFVFNEGFRTFLRLHSEEFKSFGFIRRVDK